MEHLLTFSTWSSPSNDNLSMPNICECFPWLGDVLGSTVEAFRVHSLTTPTSWDLLLYFPFAFGALFFVSLFPCPGGPLSVPPDGPLGRPLGGSFGGCPEDPPREDLLEGPFLMFSTSVRGRVGAWSNHLCQSGELSRVFLCPTTTRPILALVRRTFSLHGSSEYPEWEITF